MQNKYEGSLADYKTTAIICSKDCKTFNFVYFVKKVPKKIEHSLADY